MTKLADRLGATRAALSAVLGAGLTTFGIATFALFFAWLIVLFVVKISPRAMSTLAEQPSIHSNNAIQEVTHQRVSEGCNSRVAADWILVLCEGKPVRVAYLSGVRVRLGVSLESLVAPLLFHHEASRGSPRAGKSLRSQSSPTRATAIPAWPSLQCTVDSVTAVYLGVSGLRRLDELLATCHLPHGQDLAAVLLRGGHVSLPAESSVARAFISQGAAHNRYVDAQTAARRARAGIWWDVTYATDEPADPIVARAAADAQMANRGAVLAATQAWIASALVFGGSGAAFLMNRMSLAVRRRRRRHALLRTLFELVDRVENAAGVKDLKLAKSRAEAVSEWLEEHLARPFNRNLWETYSRSLGDSSTNYSGNDENLERFKMSIRTDELGSSLALKPEPSSDNL